MASTADFRIDASPQADAGFDATNGATLTLQLEADPGLDVERVRFYQVQKTLGAPDLVFSDAGQPANPLDPVTVDMPAADAHSYVVAARINGGVDASSVSVAAWTRERLIAIRSVAGLRKIAPAETTQYDPSFGWTEAFNEGVEQLAGGDVAGPVTSTDHALARWDGPDGDQLDNSLATLSDAGLLSAPVVRTGDLLLQSTERKARWRVREHADWIEFHNEVTGQRFKLALEPIGEEET